MAHQTPNGKAQCEVRGPILRRSPEDFEVEEIPSETPSGEGPHTLVEVSKRDRTTEAVAGELARVAGVSAREVGFAGRKDRWAVTRQWFSVPHFDPEEALALELDGAQVLAAQRHSRKIRPGDLLGNRFRLVIHEVDDALADRVHHRLGELEIGGYPNRFGTQRFGRHGDNAPRGAALLRGEPTRLDRRAARFLVTALQSAVFNRVLDLRSVGIDTLRGGDVAVRHAMDVLVRVNEAESRSEEMARELRDFVLSPTGPLFGPKMWLPRGETLAEEERAMAELGLPKFAELSVPRWLKLPGTRRSLRARLREASMSRGEGSIELRFVLGAGSYATILVDELFAGTAVRDCARQS